MQRLHCTYRNHTIVADVIEYEGSPLPWAAGCRITAPDGRSSRRFPLPHERAFLSDRDKAEQVSLAHGKWLVDQHLDQSRELFASAA
ncbi:MULTISPECIES: hypothetical protein [Pseudomonas]|mgnify:CR=1 FL=1|uniref:Uncharacterized protein n=1 Tax=Pseudomonas flexibilis TaxID=706570 RepID=A0A0B3C362_9PSED|nr:MULTISPECIES: hypothetical protein [Pseudomonas]KHO65957.1 hypothetical protein PT85_04010 [Pseudomonas flexibilis]SCX87415.1 hypothetical protein SAMN02927929_00779 [Pseudomonas flexibilis]SIP89863.1 hypothetical protein SAMN05421672_101232 [Pseudomonas flexibilis]